MGTSFACNYMFFHIGGKVWFLNENGDDIEVSNVVDIVYNYLVWLCPENKGFGTLIAGHDEKKWLTHLSPFY